MRCRVIKFNCDVKGIEVKSLVLNKDKTGWRFLLTDSTIQDLLARSLRMEDIKTDFDTLYEIIMFVKGLPTLHGRKL